MGYCLAIVGCVRCNRMFSCNPVRVPSMRVNGVREPICEPCVRWANTEREKLGYPLFTIHPDAYEAVNEMELP